MTRAEHLRWCKDRANEYLDRGDIKNAVTSMLSDLTKHEETADLAEGLTLVGMMVITEDNYASAKRFIEGFT